jgi:hypothetical protein
MATKKNETAAAEPKPTKADFIWEMIKDRPIQVFALPNQTVKDHCTMYPIDPEAVYLRLKSTAVLTALEEVLKNVPISQHEMFDVSQTPTYTILRIIPKVI